MSSRIVTSEQEIIETAVSIKPDLVATVLDYVSSIHRERQALQDGILAIRTIDRTCEYTTFKHGDVEIIAQHRGHVPDDETPYALVIDTEQVESVDLPFLLQLRDSLNTLLDCPAVVGALA